MDNKEFGKLLAVWCFKNNVTKVPFPLNEEQYNSFIKEYRYLEYNTDTSAGHPKPIEINTKDFSTLEELSSIISKVSAQAFNDYLIYGKCILHVLDDDIVRYSEETQRIKDKEP